MSQLKIDVLHEAQKKGFKGASIMNELQDCGIVSDNAVWLDDVAEVDLMKALQHFKEIGIIYLTNPRSGCRFCDGSRLEIGGVYQFRHARWITRNGYSHCG